ncbi:hypothetical protein [Desulfovibrio sp. Fe33]|uniref:hypothetical protein n=1 Tax=Desulfovibrio sp. Fe33 TaxID=3020842 RepID=UPI00234C1655|nr:hypothetical protein [Desulfovibrio sp. Fe33]
MKKFISIAEGKLVNDGMQPTAKAKLDLLTDSEDAQPTFPFILENLGLHACLDAMDAASYKHEDFIEKTLRLLAIDAAYRVMPLWEDSDIAQDNLGGLMRMAHLHAHGEVEYEELQECLWQTAQPIMLENMTDSPISGRDARDCALLTGSHNLVPALNKAAEAVRSYHGAWARLGAYSGTGNRETGLRCAWRRGSPISFGAAFGATSKHVLAAVEAEIWHVAYTLADELLKLQGYENVEITEKEMESFLPEALASAARGIAHNVVHKGARRVIESILPAKTYEEALRQAKNAAQEFFKDACSAPDLYEQLAIGRVTLTATCHDFDDQATFTVCHALHYLLDENFHKAHPLNPKADGIAKEVALDARKQLYLAQVADAAAGSFAWERETEDQSMVLARLLSEDQ